MRFRLLGKRDLVCNCFLGFLLAFSHFFLSICVGIFLSRTGSILVGICVGFVCIFLVGFCILSICIFLIGFCIRSVRIFLIGFCIRSIRIFFIGFCIRSVCIFLIGFCIRSVCIFLIGFCIDFCVRILLGFLRREFLRLTIDRYCVFLAQRLRFCRFLRRVRSLLFLFGIRDVGFCLIFCWSWTVISRRRIGYI